MKSRIVTLLGVALATSAYADFNPVVLTPGSFNADVIVEKTAPKPFNDYVSATMDGGTNNNGSTFFENGYNPTQPWTGVPAHNSTFTAVTDAGHQFRMPPDYAANNAVFLTTNTLGPATGTLTLTTPTPFTTLSVLCSAGNGPVNVNYTIHHAGGGTETGTMSVPDWTAGTTIAWYANGRVSMDNGNLASLAYTNGTNRRLLYNDIALTDTAGNVTSVDFAFASTSGRAVFFGLSGSTGGTFTPVVVTGFNKDVVVEATAPAVGFARGAGVTIDGGPNGTGNTFYEQGYNRGAPTTGIPVAGSTVTVGVHSFTMAPSYTANNVFCLGDFAGYRTATMTLPAPASYTGLSFLGAAGNGTHNLTVTVHHSADADEVFSPVSIGDWFNGANPIVTANGRTVPSTLGFDNVNNNNPRLYAIDIALTGASSVTSVDLQYLDTGNQLMIFALGGSTSGTYSPVAVAGYNADGVVEASLPNPGSPYPLPAVTTASMDGGTNNTGSTWMEKGYYAAMPQAGLPAPGTIINSITQPDHHYQMPASYTVNNAVYVDAAHATANLTIAAPATYSALSFLSATANNNVTNQVVMQYADGTQETNTFVSRDWFNNTPFAYTSRGRISLDNRVVNNDPGHNADQNPRLYEAQFALGNTGSPVTNVVLKFLGAINPTTARMVVLAVSATAGAVPPIITTVSPQTLLTMEGSNVVLTATVTGGTQPITYRWQMRPPGATVFTDLVNGGNISGASTTNLTFTSIGWTNAGDYQMVGTNIAGFGVSPIATFTVLSGLPDVTQPTDAITIFNGAANPGEEVYRAIDNTTSKYLNNGISAGPVGFEVTPAIGGTILSVLRFYTANDATERDPASYLLEGSIDGGATYITIASNSVALPDGRNAGALALDPLGQVIREVRFANTVGANKYRVSFATTKAASTLLQIGEVELLGVLDPHAIPTVLMAPANTTANEGATATFSVTAVGPGTLGYRWYDVTGGEPGTLIAGQNTSTLSLPSVTLAMSGNTYRVVVFNQFGAVTSPELVNPGAQLTVVGGPPVITTDLPAEGMVYVGRTAVLPVTLSGKEPFTLQWQKNGINLSDTGRIIGSHSNVLSIAQAQLSDADTYQLATIHNDLGDAQSAVQDLTVQKIPALTPNGAGWALNGTPSPAVVSGSVLELTYGAGNTARSAWYKFPLYIGAFKASFLYQDVGGGGADGMAFALQNDSRGTTALGGGGGGLAYLGITNSVALQFNIYNAGGIAFNTNGNVGGFSPSTPVDVAGGDPIRTEVTYASGVMHVVLSNTVTAGTFATNFLVGNLPAQLGSTTANVGFTGASGGVASTQYISEFTFIPVPTLTAQAVGGAVVLSWPASIGGYTIESSGSLTTPNWADAGLAVSLVGNQNQATVSGPTGIRYYRLVITP